VATNVEIILSLPSDATTPVTRCSQVPGLWVSGVCCCVGACLQTLPRAWFHVGTCYTCHGSVAGVPNVSISHQLLVVVGGALLTWCGCCWCGCC
jgi:hypothetical protein